MKKKTRMRCIPCYVLNDNCTFRWSVRSMNCAWIDDPDSMAKWLHRPWYCNKWASDHQLPVRNPWRQTRKASYHAACFIPPTVLTSWYWKISAILAFELILWVTGEYHHWGPVIAVLCFLLLTWTSFWASNKLECDLKRHDTHKTSL